jgi:hypothetical protein
MTSELATKVRRHMEHSEQYFENGLEALRNEEVSKAGEMFWGSVTQVFHALAAVRGIDVARHRRLKNFAIQVSSETDDPYLLAGFSTAEILHKGFYDVDVELADLEAAVPIARRTIEAVARLIPQDSNDQLGSNDGY